MPICGTAAGVFAGMTTGITIVAFLMLTKRTLFYVLECRLHRIVF
jgi:hypothetical protein